ncbi:MAG: hypothetical protein MJ093_08865, partial [Saccharofermentans sp.]|nr:hypothetical protein [Saccharofermentans sp.]
MKIKRLVAGLLTVAMVIAPITTVSRSVFADSEIQITSTLFKDKSIRDYVSNNFDTNKNGYLSTDERLAAKKISFSGHLVRITDITNVAKVFPNIEQLNFDTNLTNLDFSEFTNLKELSLNGTWASEEVKLNVSMNTKLERLDLEHVNIRSLDVSNNTNLKYLEIFDTELKSLDVSNNKKLARLSIDKSPVQTLTAGDMPNILELAVGDIDNLSIDLSKSTELRALVMTNMNVPNLDLSNCSKLEHVNLAESKVETLDLSHNPALIYIDVEDSTLSSLDISNNPELIWVSVAGTNIQEINIYNNPNLLLALGAEGVREEYRGKNYEDQEQDYITESYKYERNEDIIVWDTYYGYGMSFYKLQVTKGTTVHTTKVVPSTQPTPSTTPTQPSQVPSTIP